MARIWAIARVTFQEGLRMRVVLVFVAGLLLLMLVFPFTLRGDDTVSGRLRNFLEYSLGAVGFFLALATIFLSSATIATEIRDKTIHLIVTKPVSRFQILVGKWIGVNLLNLLMLAICGGAIYGFATFIAGRPEQFARDRMNVRDIVWAARVGALPEPPDFAAFAMESVNERIQNGRLQEAERESAIRKTAEDMKFRWRAIEPQEYRVYDFRNLPVPPPGDQTVVQIRFKLRANPMPLDEMLEMQWLLLDPDSDAPLMPEPMVTKERANDTHSFLIRAAAIRADPERPGSGRARLVVINPATLDERRRVFFDTDDSLQILYKVSSFEANFAKALLITFLRLTIISAVGVFFSIFVSFPIACCCNMVFYFICFFWGWWMEAIGANEAADTWDPKIDPYGHAGPMIRFFLVPILRIFFPNFNYYSGAAKLVNGEYIDWNLISACGVHTIVYGSILLLVVGWLVFWRREVAEVTV